MKKAILFLSLLILTVSCGAENEVDTQEIPLDDAVFEIELVIENGLASSDLVEIWIDPSDEPWSDNLLDFRLAPGEEFVFAARETTFYDIQIIDEDGESYTLLDEHIDEDGFNWTVVAGDSDWNTASSGELTTVTVENGLDKESLWYCFGTLSSSEEWGIDRLDWMVLEPGDSFSFKVESGYYYDFYARNGNSGFYFAFDNYIDDKGFNWVISQHDLDNSIYEDETSGASASVSVINRLGSVSIVQAFGDESGGEYWGEDLLEGDILAPQDEFTFYIPPERFYDFQVEDEYGNTYTLWEVSVKDNGIFWEVTQDDMDR